MTLWSYTTLTDSALLLCGKPLGGGSGSETASNVAGVAWLCQACIPVKLTVQAPTATDQKLGGSFDSLPAR